MRRNHQKHSHTPCKDFSARFFCVSHYSIRNARFALQNTYRLSPSSERFWGFCDQHWSLMGVHSISLKEGPIFGHWQCLFLEIPVKIPVGEVPYDCQWLSTNHQPGYVFFSFAISRRPDATLGDAEKCQCADIEILRGGMQATHNVLPVQCYVDAAMLAQRPRTCETKFDHLLHSMWISISILQSRTASKQIDQKGHFYTPRSEIESAASGWQLWQTNRKILYQ